MVPDAQEQKVYLNMKQKSDYRWGKILICAGALALLVSAGILAYNIWDENRAADSAARLTRILFQQIEENRISEVTGADTPDTGRSEDDLLSELTQDDNDSESTSVFIEIDGERFIGILSIPALTLDLPVNDNLNEIRLKETPCRYAGAIKNSLVIAGHNYRKHFGSLSKLVKGDLVTLTDAAGADHLYMVEKIETVNATDIAVMLDDSYGLTLFTCNYSGRARVAVRCVKRGDGSSASQSEADEPSPRFANNT